VCLLGLPQRVTAFIGSQRAVNESGFEDSFTVLLHYRDGAMATLRAGVVSPEERQLRFWARGENGSFKKVCLQHLSTGMFRLTGAVPYGCPGGTAEERRAAY
jgi:predicted dehydrogenase